MIHDLMVPMTGGAGDSNALKAAVGLAAHCNAHLSVVETVNLPLPMPSPWGFSPDVRLGVLYAELRAQGEANAAALRHRLEPETISHEVRLADALYTEPQRTVALHARYADLAIMTAVDESSNDSIIVHPFFSALVFESGRPLLVIPPKHSIELPFGHVVVAWQPTREATRAVHDAMPLLRTASSVDVVTVDPLVGECYDGALPGADIATHLARHNVKVNVVTLPLDGRSVADVLLDHASESRADLLVAGAYSHSRLREWVWGGTTRELLRKTWRPILFSH